MDDQVAAEMAASRHSRFDDFMAEAVLQQSVSVFCHRLLTFLAIGVLSANQVQWLCEGLALDGKIDPMVSVYAKAGTDYTQ